MTIQPWFKRIWVWQEFILAREREICYGRHRIMWEILHRDFVSILIRIMANTDEPARGVPYPPSTDPHHLMAWSIPADGQDEQEKFHVMSQGRLRLEAETCFDVLGLRLWASRPRASKYDARNTGNFVEQLVTTKDLSATDPRDKVFGILGTVVFKKEEKKGRYYQATQRAHGLYIPKQWLPRYMKTWPAHIQIGPSLRSPETCRHGFRTWT